MYNVYNTCIMYNAYNRYLQIYGKCYPAQYEYYI